MEVSKVDYTFLAQENNTSLAQENINRHVWSTFNSYYG